MEESARRSAVTDKLAQESQEAPLIQSLRTAGAADGSDDWPGGRSARQGRGRSGDNGASSSRRSLFSQRRGFAC